LVKTLKAGKLYIIKVTLPIAFHELEKSLHIVKNDERTVSLVADAPHAEAVELGSRPHVPPLEPLIEWVKLRGMQGLYDMRHKLKGTTTRQHAKNIAQTLHIMALGHKQGKRTAMRKAGFSKQAIRAGMAKQGLSNDINDPVEIARAIQQAIAKRGTRPHKYMANALPEIERQLDINIKLAIEDP
jgi:hypothetical protein